MTSTSFAVDPASRRDLSSSEEVSEVFCSAASCDVCVVGGGVAGVAAALQAGRAGARTVLVEQAAMVGGDMTSGGVKCSGGTCFVGSNVYPDTCYYPFEFMGKSVVVDIRGIMYWDDRSEHGCADHDGALLKCDEAEDPCLKIDGGFWGVCGNDADPHWMKYLYNPKLDIRNVTVRSQMDIKGANLDTLCMNTTLPDYRVSYATNAFCKVAEIFTTEKTGTCEATLTLDHGAAWRLAFQKAAGSAAKMTATPLNDLCSGREIKTADGDGTLKVFLKADAPFAGRFTTTRMTPRFRPVDFGNLRTHGGEVRYRECVTNRADTRRNLK